MNRTDIYPFLVDSITMYDSAEDKTHLILVNAVVFKGDKVLVSRRSLEEPHEPGKWTIPGGEVERTDDVVFNIVEKTLKDEVMEETDVEIHDRVEMITNNSFIRSTGQNVVALVFRCEYKSGDPKPLEDTVDCKWASFEEVKKMEFAPNVKKYILKAFEPKQ
jgi:ADP-ribose pyrophosphatase YjhB (NUDIX family)